LHRAFQEFLREYPAKQIGTQRDSYGTYALIVQRPNGKTYFFTAKNSQDGENVSCHKALVYESGRVGYPIVMWINGAGYLYYAGDILGSKPKSNQHNGAEMLNFSIRLGTPLRLVGKRSEPGNIEELKQHPNGRILLNLFPDLAAADDQYYEIPAR